MGPVLFDRPSVREARELIESQGLRFEPEFDDLVGLFEDGRLVACGARAGYVLKMLVIAPSHQGTDILGELVTKLILSAISAGHDSVFVFTLPQNVASFEALNFRLLVTHGQTALLEHGPGLEDYLARHAVPDHPGTLTEPSSSTAIHSPSAIFTWWNARPSALIASTSSWCARTGRFFPSP